MASFARKCPRLAGLLLLAAAAFASGLMPAPSLAEFQPHPRTGVPSISPSADQERPAYYPLPSTKQPDFQLPERPRIEVRPQVPAPRLPRLPPPLLSPDAQACAEVFAPVCGQIGNQARQFSNDCQRRAAGAVRLADRSCTR